MPVNGHLFQQLLDACVDNRLVLKKGKAADIQSITYECFRFLDIDYAKQMYHSMLQLVLSGSDLVQWQVDKLVALF